MTLKRLIPSLALVALATCFALAAGAQVKCPAPPALTPSHEPNIFSPQQEVDLGDVEAEQLETNFHIIHDDALTAYVNGVLKKLVAQMPPTGLQFRVTIIDVPIINSFSLPGGRIYITRKMIAFMQNEDELAGLLGHEMGHILTRQMGIEVTYQLQSVLGVTSVGDRKDIFDKMNLLLDNSARNPKAFQKAAREEEPDQYQADQVSLYVGASAGYSPQNFIDLLNRLQKTNGKTGNRVTDFFGMTTPTQKRLRLIEQSLQAMPEACRSASAVAASQQFHDWQTSVIAFSGLNQTESLFGLVGKQALDPPLRTDITNLKFSPNGQYVLAQDDASVFVLIRSPFTLLFRLDAADADDAQFTPDSQGIVFATRGLRVESWSIPEQKRLSAQEMTVQSNCESTLLSPDGKTLACLTSNFVDIGDWTFNLLLIDVATGKVTYEKDKAFALHNPFAILEVLIAGLSSGDHFHLVDMTFSRDARYFAVAGLDQVMAYDLQSHAVVPLHGELASLMKFGFTFLAPDRVIARDASSPQKSAIMDFPAGTVIQRVTIQNQMMVAPTKGNYVLLEPATSTVAAGVLSLETGKYVAGDRASTALDVYDQDMLTQSVSGDVTINNLGSKEILAKASIPHSPLGALRAEGISPDLRWLAISGDTRGAVWDLSKGKRMYYLRGFRGAYIDGSQGFYGDFPRLGTDGRTIGHADLSGTDDLMKETAIDDKSPTHQYGKYLFTMPVRRFYFTPTKDKSLNVQDAATGQTLWSRPFPKEVPELFVSSATGKTILEWAFDDEVTKDEIKADPALKARLATIRDHSGVDLLEVLDSGSGKILGRMLVDTGKGSFRIRRAYAEGDWVVIGDQDNRTLVYSLSSGEQKGTFFGTYSAISTAAGLLTVENADGEVDVYSLPTMEKCGQMLFPSRVSMQAYSADGKRLLILTANQTAYTFDTSVLAKGAAVTAAK